MASGVFQTLRETLRNFNPVELKNILSMPAQLNDNPPDHVKAENKAKQERDDIKNLDEESDEAAFQRIIGFSPRAGRDSRTSKGRGRNPDAEPKGGKRKRASKSPSGSEDESENQQEQSGQHGEDVRAIIFQFLSCLRLLLDQGRVEGKIHPEGSCAVAQIGQGCKD